MMMNAYFCTRRVTDRKEVLHQVPHYKGDAFEMLNDFSLGRKTRKIEANSQGRGGFKGVFFVHLQPSVSLPAASAVRLH